MKGDLTAFQKAKRLQSLVIPFSPAASRFVLETVDTLFSE
jgi:hypothetical protein